MDLDEIALERVRNSKDVGYEQLRKARTKWDICWNLAFRRFFAQLSYSQSWLNLFVDCSPQKRGQELFSASLEVIVDSIETYFLRRMFPQISIGVSCTTLLGKVVSLLWAIFLLVGPNYYAFRSFLGCVTWILTDYGTEKGVPDFQDILGVFLVAIGVHVPADAVQLDFLFPHAMFAPGWEHSIDGLLRYFLCLFPWFPTFLRDLKNLARLINRYGPNLADTLDMAGLRGAAAVIRKQSVATLAHWRWGTILEACKDCCISFPILRLNLESIRAYLHTIRDTVIVKGAMRTFTDVEWQRQLEVVSWSIRHMVSLGKWIGSCVCHADQYKNRIAVECDRKVACCHMPMTNSLKRLRP